MKEIILKILNKEYKRELKEFRDDELKDATEVSDYELYTEEDFILPQILFLLYPNAKIVELFNKELEKNEYFVIFRENGKTYGMLVPPYPLFQP